MMIRATGTARPLSHGDGRVKEAAMKSHRKELTLNLPHRMAFRNITPDVEWRCVRAAFAKACAS